MPSERESQPVCQIPRTSLRSDRTDTCQLNNVKERTSKWMGQEVVILEGNASWGEKYLGKGDIS